MLSIRRIGVNSRPLIRCYATTVKMPSLSPTMEAGTIVRWTKKEGDSIAPGDVLCEIQTDKAVVSMEHDEDGVMAKILKNERSGEINVGDVIAVLADPDEDWKTVEIPVDSVSTKSEAPSPSTSSIPQKPTQVQNVQANVPVTDVHLYGPATRLYMELYGIKPKDVTPSGPKGSLMKSDVLAYVKLNNIQAKKFDVTRPKVQEQPPSPPEKSPSQKAPTDIDFDHIELTNMRKSIAKRLTFSKQTVPHEYVTTAIKMDNVLKLRKQFKNDGVSVTVNDFIIKAVANSLRIVPRVNVTYRDDQLLQIEDVDVSVAVATPNGLITPIVKSADKLGLEAISKMVKELAGRAKENKLQLHEFQGGTFTISNLGMMGISHFNAIINPPQCAILAIGNSESVAVTNEAAKEVPLSDSVTNGLKHVKFENRMRVTLCYDARAIDSADAAMFVETFVNLLSNPDELVSGGILDSKLFASDLLSDRELAALL